MSHPDVRRFLVIPPDHPLHDALQTLGRRYRLVFVAGLPGTGKSLLLHQLAHLAALDGRRVHLLQWDVARPVFETHPAGRRYPLDRGVTHPVIRKAVGIWVRRAVAKWHDRHPGDEHLLIGETPLVGARFIDLVRPQDDEAEPLLQSPVCRFVIPVPSRAVRRRIEAERQRRSARPVHPREAEDAPPQVMQDLWQDLVRSASRLGIAPPSAAGQVPYDPEVYRQVYAALLRHRPHGTLRIDTAFPTEAMSVYAYGIDPRPLIPTSEDVVGCLAQVERAYPDPRVLQREIDAWDVVERA